MKITNHLLSGARLELIPGGAKMETRRFLVMHYTAGMTAMSSIEFWRSPEADGANAHVVIDRDGTLYQCRPFDRTAGHAGVSQWRHNGVLYEGINRCGIGIELANAGDCIKGGKLFGKYAGNPIATAAHKWEPKKQKSWEQFSSAQIAVCKEISALIVKTYNLDDVVGHEDIAPPGLRKRGDWKPDPGPLFPMAELRAHCGFHQPLAKLF